MNGVMRGSRFSRGSERTRTPRGMARTPEPGKSPELSVVWREAKEVIWTRRRRLAVGFVLMVIGRATGLVLPASSKYLIDTVIRNRRADLLWPLALAVIAASLVQASSSFALSQILGVTAQRAITEMRRRVHRHIMRLRVSFFDSVKSGELISRVMVDAEGIRNLVGSGLVELCGGLLTAVVAIAVLFYLNWKLTLFTLLVLSIFFAVNPYAFMKLRPLFRERGALNAKTTGRLAESLGGIRIVKAYTAEKREERIFTRDVHELFRNVAKSVTAFAALGAFATLVLGAVGVLMILGGGRAILAGEMTLGDFVMYVSFIGLVAAPLVQISSIATQLSEAFAGLDRIREIRSLPTEEEQDRDREPLPSLDGAIRFENVWFEYNEGIPVLKDICFEAAPGTTTALVGSSGSGKSTLVSLVLTFNRPKAGRILVDGRDLSRIRLRDYRSKVGVVLQDNFLFDGTVRENVSYSRPHASFEEILEACRIAHCDEFVERLPDGYDTVVGERGVKLSGGQRQRISIARAILANPRILVLDEATSSLDSESEALIQDGLHSLREGRTTFVIAHRLSTIVSADQILVLEQGKIIERGRHGELLALGGRYRELYDRQYRLEMNRFINPGEDFTPEPEVVRPAPRITGTEGDL
jgi:subfamily B ATP-binding cassette protein MsbA